jgi:hypothetical protein
LEGFDGPLPPFTWIRFKPHLLPYFSPDYEGIIEAAFYEECQQEHPIGTVDVQNGVCGVCGDCLSLHAHFGLKWRFTSRSYPGAVRVYQKFTVTRRLIMLDHT